MAAPQRVAKEYQKAGIYTKAPDGKIYVVNQSSNRPQDNGHYG